jgi:hypothetical protein
VDQLTTATAGEVDAESIFQWRRELLERAGFDSRSSLALALTPTVDVHSAITLLEKGCPVALAVRILL